MSHVHGKHFVFTLILWVLYKGIIYDEKEETDPYEGLVR